MGAAQHEQEISNIQLGPGSFENRNLTNAHSGRKQISINIQSGTSLAEASLKNRGGMILQGSFMQLGPFSPNNEKSIEKESADSFAGDQQDHLDKQIPSKKPI